MYIRILHSTMKNMTCVVVTALCNQFEAFASDLGDDQSHYLLIITGATDTLIIAADS